MCVCTGGSHTQCPSIITVDPDFEMILDESHCHRQKVIPAMVVGYSINIVTFNFPKRFFIPIPCIAVPNHYVNIHVLDIVDKSTCFVIKVPLVGIMSNLGIML